MSEEFDAKWELELQLEELIAEWEGIGLNVENIRRSIQERGAVETVRRYATGNVDAGMRAAREQLGPDKTMEALLLKDEFSELYSDADRVATRRKFDRK